MPELSQRPSRSTLLYPVFVPSLLLIVLMLGVLLTQPQAAQQLLSQTQGWITHHFSAFYALLVAGLFFFLLGLACSSYGRIRLGDDDSRPEFSLGSWLAMLFAAGMGIGLMYYGVGEPLQHFVSPHSAAPRTAAAASEAMSNTFVHWGFLAWGIYGLVGLVLAYFAFRHRLPLSLRSGLYPLLGERIHGRWGHAIDVFALLCTLFGLAPSLGLGVLQLQAGVEQLSGHALGSSAQWWLMGAVLALAAVSVSTGLARGVRRLSELNLLLALGLMLFVLLCGPTSYLLAALAENLANYLGDFAQLNLRTFSYAGASAQGWFEGWTILYWAWWISWSPFVGLFIARISKGRTIREFIAGVILVPSLLTFVWMTVFGNSVLWFDTQHANGALSALSGNVNALLFAFFQYLPLPALSSTVALVLICVFFVTSADSGALMLDQLASRKTHASPLWQRLLWLVLLGLIAGALLQAGGLQALQSMTLIAALPFAVIMLVLALTLWHALGMDQREQDLGLSPASHYWQGGHWRLRLQRLLQAPTREVAQHFLQQHARVALAEVCRALQESGQDATLEQASASELLILRVRWPQQADFVYGVQLVQCQQARAGLLMPTLAWRVHTWFDDVREGYAIDALRQEEISADALKQLERHQRWQHASLAIYS